VRRSYDAIADRYDEYVGYAEQILLGNGRHWVGAQAHGDVLEIGVGTGRNFPFYAPDVRLTGIDLTPAMLQQARDRAATLGIDRTSVWATRRRSISPMTGSTRSS
jgi:ubiquinone/menaquinone biosynthesis C-methylase UbiE